MTMIPQLLAVVVAVGLGVDSVVCTDIPPVQPYKEQVEALEDTARALLINVISMERHIPPLNDSRRHYVEIFHVANYHGRQKSLNPEWPYSYVYYEELETLAPQAIKNPELVISQVKYLLDGVHNKTNEIQDLINACHESPVVCNQLIDDTVKENEDQYRAQAIVLSVAARTAKLFNEKNGKFEEVSDDLRAHQYVCKSPDELLNLVMELANLYIALK